MSRTKSSIKKNRLTLEVSDDSKKEIEEIMQEKDIENQSEALRKAIKMMHMIVVGKAEVTIDGKKVIFI